MMELQKAVPWGRSFTEYSAMFALSEEDLSKRILGCADGPASFNAELTERGGDITSVDPLYRFTATDIERRIEEVAEDVMGQMAETKDRYVWRQIPDLTSLRKTRMDAMGRFLADYDLGQRNGRYQTASLPDLPFDDQAFDLALCSHFLFLYSAQVDFQTHLNSLFSLLRVAREVRIYPLIALDGRPSPHLKPAMEALIAQKYICERVSVGYEFQRGATEMLRIRHPLGA